MVEYAHANAAGTLEKLKVAKGFDDELKAEMTKLINDYKDIFLSGRE